jgi:hypothetical protein
MPRHEYDNQWHLPPGDVIDFTNAATANMRSRCAYCCFYYHEAHTFIAPGTPHRICRNCWSANTLPCHTCGNRYFTHDLRAHEDENRYCVSCLPPPRENEDAYATLSSSTFRRITSRRKVGFELEFLVPSNSERGEPELSDWGNVHDDGSVGGARCYGREFASNPARGDMLLRVIRSVCSRLRENGCKVNQTCGFHVHLDMRESTPTGRRNLIAWWAVFEPIAYAMQPASRSRNQYCRWINANGGTVSIPARSLPRDRYLSLNCAAFHKYGTFEIRLHAGTTDACKVENWTRFLLHFFDTFEALEPTADRMHEIAQLSDRQVLAYFFRAMRLPSPLRRYVMRRLREFDSTLTRPLRLRRAA